MIDTVDTGRDTELEKPAAERLKQEKMSLTL